MSGSTSSGVGTTRPPWKTAVLGGFASYMDSATIVAGGTAWVLYQDRMSLDAWDVGALSAILTFSLAVGALVGGRLGDRFGRKRVFSVDLLLLAAGLAFLVFAPSAGFLYVGVIIAGFAMGADIPVSLALIAEESAPEDRGRMVAFSQVMWIGGIAASTILGFAVSTLGPLGARILFAHVLVVAIVVWVLRRALPESRQWNEAVAVASGSSRTDALGVDRRVGVVSTRQHKGKIKDLAPFLAPLIATALFYTFNNLSANTLGQFSTYLFTNVAGVSVTAATVVGLVGLPIGLGSNFLFMRIVGGRFRTPAFVIGTASLVAGFCVPLVGGFSYGTLFAASLLAGFGGGLAGEAIYKVWSQELFPTLVRSSAQGSTIFVTRALTAAFAFVTPVIAQADPRMLMGILVALNLAAGIVGFFWVRRLPKAVEVSATERAVAA